MDPDFDKGFKTSQHLINMKLKPGLKSVSSWLLLIYSHCAHSNTSTQFLFKHVQIIYVMKLNVKLSLCLTKHHAMKMNWGSGGIVPRITYIGIGCR